jgi:hypothetical protein
MPVYRVIEGVSSNKQEGEEKKKGKIESSEISYCPIKGRVAVLKPFIDKITITHKIADEELVKTLVESLLQEADKEQGHFKKAAQFKSGAVSYKASVSLIVPPGDAQVLLQAGPKKKGTAHALRLEFNPRRLGKPGIAFLKSQIECLALGPVVSDDLSFDDIIAKGTVTRVDIAVDVVGIRVDQLDVRFLGDGKSHWYHSKKGQPETGYYGIKQNKKKQNSPAPWVTYNKRQELKDKGPEGGKQLYGGLSHTRIEFHAIQKKPFAKLGTLANPFGTISLAYPEAPKGIKPYAWAFFLDSCQRRGREASLELLPEGALRKRYRQALDKAHAAFWKPDTIWASWQESLFKSGL